MWKIFMIMIICLKPHQLFTKTLVNKSLLCISNGFTRRSWLCIQACSWYWSQQGIFYSRSNSEHKKYNPTLVSICNKCICIEQWSKRPLWYLIILDFGLHNDTYFPEIGKISHKNIIIFWAFFFFWDVTYQDQRILIN